MHLGWVGGRPARRTISGSSSGAQTRLALADDIWDFRHEAVGKTAYEIPMSSWQVARRHSPSNRNDVRNEIEHHRRVPTVIIGA